ncbi:hypothetical protein KGY72_08255 [Candidatus Bipolaricaulota bacterium]|nr:hypothetical protein [Candidatus Bipolaricaulota bacterium]MBS3792731.1 hypothetical protein [Candidatus Bipolaricaulota bacterium]
MNEKTITVMSWNLQGEVGIGKSRLEEIFEFIKQCFAILEGEKEGTFDLLLLQAVPYDRGPEVCEGLKLKLGYPAEGIVDTLDWARSLGNLSCQPHQDLNHDRGNVTASCWKAERIPLSIHDQSGVSNFYTNFPEKIIQTRLSWPGWGRLEAWNAGIIAGAGADEEKVMAIKTITTRLERRASRSGRKRTLVLGGDFNTPNFETPDGQAVPYGHEKNTHLKGDWASTELELLKNLNRWRLRDALRFVHGYEDTKNQKLTHYSHVTTGGTKKRLDHLFVDSKALIPERCFYPATEVGMENIPSDHSPIVARLKLVD